MQEDLPQEENGFYSKRFLAVDIAKGIAILLMVLVHVLVQQIGQTNYELAGIIFSNAPFYVMIILIPLFILSMWGTVFTFLYVLGIVIKLNKIGKENSKRQIIYLVNKTFIGALIIILNRFAWGLKALLNPKYTFHISWCYMYEAEALDSIIWGGIFCVYLYFILQHVDKTQDGSMTVYLFIFLSFLLLIISPIFIILGQSALENITITGFNLKAYILSKFTQGRFKLMQTMAFSLIGVSYGTMLYRKYSFTRIKQMTLIILGIGIYLFSILTIIDVSHLVNYASEDISTELQFVNIALMMGGFSLFLKTFDFNTHLNKKRLIEKTKWIRRYSVISLTIYTFDSKISRLLYSSFSQVWGISVRLNENTPYLAWNIIQILFFMVIAFVYWELIMRVWEKLGFIFTYEWILRSIQFLFDRKTNPFGILLGEVHYSFSQSKTK